MAARRATLGIALSLALSLAPAAAARQPDLAGALDAIASEGLAEGPVVGLLLAVGRPGRPPLVATAGLRDRARGLPFLADTPWRIGSVTKNYVAALVLRLDGEGLLDLDDRLAKWVSDVPNGEAVTLRQLLSHTSGYRDYFNEVYLARAIAEPAHRWSPREMIAYGRPESLLFPPGAGFAYANTNYVLLGLVVEAATGGRVSTALRARFLDPLGLARTWLAGEEPLPADEVARGYSDEDGDGLLEDVTDRGYGLGWTDGALVSDAADLVRWAEALFGGRVLSPAELEAMLLPPVVNGAANGYGLGVELDRIDGISFVGHTGSTPGYNTIWRYQPETAVTVVVAVNEDPPDPALLDALFLRVLAAVESHTAIRFPRRQELAK